MNGLSDGNALVLAILPDQPLLFAAYRCDPDPALFRRPQLPQDIAGNLLEGIASGEGFGIHNDEKVAELIGLRVALIVFIRERSEKLTCSKGRGQDFHNGGVSIALVAGKPVADTAERSKSGGSVGQPLQDFGTVGKRGSVARSPCRPACPCRCAHELIFPLLADACGAVQHKGKLLVRRKTDGKRIGSQHIFNAESGSDGGTGVCARDADHAGIHSHAGPVPGYAVMKGFANGGRGQAICSGLSMMVCMAL